MPASGPRHSFLAKENARSGPRDPTRDPQIRVAGRIALRAGTAEVVRPPSPSTGLGRFAQILIIKVDSARSQKPLGPGRNVKSEGEKKRSNDSERSVRSLHGTSLWTPFSCFGAVLFLQSQHQEVTGQPSRIHCARKKKEECILFGMEIVVAPLTPMAMCGLLNVMLADRRKRPCLGCAQCPVPYLVQSRAWRGQRLLD